MQVGFVFRDCDCNILLTWVVCYIIMLYKMLGTVVQLFFSYCYHCWLGVAQSTDESEMHGVLIARGRHDPASLVKKISPQIFNQRMWCGHPYFHQPSSNGRGTVWNNFVLAFYCVPLIVGYLKDNVIVDDSVGVALQFCVSVFSVVHTLILYWLVP